VDLPWQVLAADTVLAIALLVSVVTDLRSRLILNAVTLPAVVVVLVCFFWVGGPEQLLNCLIGLAICAGPLLLLYLWKKDAMGAGDIKLMAVAGAASGWPAALAVLLYVSVAGGIQAVLWLLAARLRGQDRPRYVPYALSIAAGTVAAFVWGDHLF
jgi:leader peptidase (prepilin peptidase)/N-methyltransferase